jgi:hypothetical protein
LSGGLAAAGVRAEEKSDTAMRTHVRFRSELFRPLKPEDQQVNPGVYGEELAKWVRDRIGAHGLDAQDHFGEDWGWMVVFGRDFPGWIGCANVTGEDDQWLCFCQVHRSLTDRLLGRPVPTESLHKTITALPSTLASEPRISDFEWFSTDSRGGEYDHAPTPG